ncbi:polysaccharide pyruvyl transferase family protein [[Pseudomonas] boreopolis]|uniref:polysaccharide pyruvyl transferase family protein n=1 Tax=Xanthomonas boreopolis TaxID=86183 RepID=UPI003D581251
MNSFDGKTSYIICTVRYSDNLGDGVIGDCLSYLIKCVDPSAAIQHFDMAGRMGYREGGVNGERNLLKKVFFGSPLFFRPLLSIGFWVIRTRGALSVAWSKVELQKPVFLVFGGGQLLSDLALNFPLKMGWVTKVAYKNRIPIAFNALGVSKKWSWLGRKLFRNSLAKRGVGYLSVRDKDSWANLIRSMPEAKKSCKVVVDPGICAAEAYCLNSERRLASGRVLKIGVGVSDPNELAAYADKSAMFSNKKMVEFFCDLICLIVQRGHIPVLFTNGSSDDECFLSVLRTIIAEHGASDDVNYMERPLRPENLVGNIAEMDAVISHRLHANIISVSLNIPNVALVWDEKVKSFMQLAGREKWCLEQGCNASEVISALDNALEVGVDLDSVRKLKNMAMENARDLVASLKHVGGMS